MKVIKPRPIYRIMLVVFILLSQSCSSDSEKDEIKTHDGIIMCMYGDSTFDIAELNEILKNKCNFSVVFNRSVPGCGYYNGSINSVYYYVARADSAIRLRFGDPINNPEINPSNLPEGCKEIDAHQYSNERINTIPRECDVVLVGGGINDIGRLSIEDVSNIKQWDDIPKEYDFNNFRDCVIATIVKIKIRCPNAQILICGISPSRTILNGGTSAEIARLADNCIARCSQLMGVSYLSLIDNLGWDAENIMIYTDGVHPNNDEGIQRYTDVICDFIKANTVY